MSFNESGNVNPDHEYFYCRKKDCSKVWHRRMPADPFKDPVHCPFCNASENEKLPDGSPAIGQVKNARQKASWLAMWAKQEKVLPIKTAPNQYITKPLAYMRDVFPKLTHLQRSLVDLLVMFTDSGTRFAAVGTRKLAVYAAPSSRETPHDLKTIREALRGMERIKVQIYRESTGEFEEVPFLRIQHVGRKPSRYWINWPGYRRSY